ncbi:MAG: outer membrane protein assembly factor BamD [Moraxella sp.]|nr:outer membrane protein assembly factor BamD [Moraxella sp.]
MTKIHSHHRTNSFSLTRLAICAVIGIGLTTTGCSTLNVFKKKDEVIARAEKSEEAYYQEAQEAIAKERYTSASLALNNLRTFYPTGKYAQQALLDLIYVYYSAKDFESVTQTTGQFIQSYPTSPYVDYAIYAQGVTHMDGSPKASKLFRLDQSQRDTAYLRLAFADFQQLVSRYPNSSYTPDAALRMTHIYNQFAEHELTAARWYIERDAYVAAAERARWVFQYYPQSTAVPEAIAILAYANDKLGLASNANQYKTLLQINYPQYLNDKGQVRIDNQKSRGLWQRTLNAASFGRLGRTDDTASTAANYDGATRTQVIQGAAQLQLPEADNDSNTIGNLTQNRRNVRIGLGLSDTEATAGNLNSVNTAANDAITTPQNTINIPTSAPSTRTAE